MTALALPAAALGAALMLWACEGQSNEASSSPSARQASTTVAAEARAAAPVAAAAAQSTSDAGGCTPIQFKRGTASATVSGHVPAEDRNSDAPEPACYSLAVGEGQQAKVNLLSGENVGITIPGVGDMRTSFDFTTHRGTYRLELYQLFPSPKAAPFRMHVEVSGSGDDR